MTETFLLTTTEELRFFAAAKPGNSVLAFTPARPHLICDIKLPYVTVELMQNSRDGQNFKVPEHIRAELARRSESHAGILRMD